MWAWSKEPISAYYRDCNDKYSATEPDQEGDIDETWHLSRTYKSVMVLRVVFKVYQSWFGLFIEAKRTRSNWSRIRKAGGL